MSDIAPALIALDTALVTVRDAGGRRLPVEDLYSGDGMHPICLEPDEIICEVVTPPLPKISPGAVTNRLARRL